MAGKTVSAHRVENGVGPRKPDHSLWLLKWLDEPRRVVTSIYRSGVPCLVLLLFPQRQNRFCDRIQCSRAQSSSKEQEVRTISDKDLRAPFVKTRSEESVPRPAGDDKLEPESKKYLGSVPLFYEENRKDYNQFASLVIEQLRPTNILEEIWVKDYTYWYLEAQRLSRFKQKLFYTAVEDSVARVISPFLHHNMLKVRLLARDWASRTPTALAEVDELLGNAGLDREAIYAQILADKLDVIERIDLMIFRAEQRRNAALHDLERWRQGVAERLHQDGTFLPQLPRGAQIDPDRAS